MQRLQAQASSATTLPVKQVVNPESPMSSRPDEHADPLPGMKQLFPCHMLLTKRNALSAERSKPPVRADATDMSAELLVRVPPRKAVACER